MSHKRLPLLAIIVLGLLVVIGGYFIVSQVLGSNNGALTASGTIEAVQINLAPEMAGKVTEVLVDEGQSVKAGDPLLHLDPSLLTAQRAAAAAALTIANSAVQTAQAGYQVAQAQYDVTLTNARAAGAKSRLADWSARTPNYFDQPQWYFTRDEQIAAAQASILLAAQEVDAAQTNLDTVVKDLKNADFVQAETRLANARIAFLSALDVYSRSQASGGTIDPTTLPLSLPPIAPGYRTRIRIAKQLSGTDDLINAAQDVYDAAKSELDAAQAAYDDLLDTDQANAVLQARAKLSVALERYQAAQDRLSMLETGENSLSVKVAQAALDQAKAAVEQALNAAKQAEANLALIDIQISKLTISAPTDAVVLTRNIEPGEFVQPGTTAFVLGKLSDLTITVYVPEDRYGELSLGQSATVTVDSFPGETFEAVIVHIADQAEFTPRNVQTVEGRSSTVYAIRLQVRDPDGKLKPGMPADVIFSEQ
ncbi:MAG: HlyD family secretion protein [Candidatus Roseilinea sp.]|uniref:HlyD family secretion protein n=1 Tax=Candidatus Roseilinea sp. TaxID=2838777 RepID=UPI0040493C8B